MDRRVGQTVHEHVEHAIRIALESTTQRRNFALVRDGARIVPQLTATGNMSLLMPADGAVEKAIQDPLHLRPTCWSFVGDRGQIGIRLSQKVIPTYIALNFARPTVSASYAPQQVVLWGVVDGGANQLIFDKGLREYRDATTYLGAGPRESLGFTFLALADVEYDPSLAFPLQTYSVESAVIDSRMVFGIVVVEIRGNWGGGRTSVCGLRIHGQVA
ncbi:hypothetical protein C8Q70DRAFT_918421 [Cubamyces menziesii]|nr:hypothetical protein C8Q70DRAFT_918421 [Cubamyces menziesii]